MRRDRGASRTGSAGPRAGARSGRRRGRSTGSRSTPPRPVRPVRTGDAPRLPTRRPASWEAAVVPPLSAVGVAGVLVLAAYAGQVVLALALLVLQACLVLLWERVTRPVDPRGVRVIAGGAALAADVAVLVAARAEPTVGPTAPVLGLVVVASLVQQILRRDGRPEVLASVAATVTLGALVTLSSGVLAVQATQAGPQLVACVIGGAALATTALALRFLRVPRVVATVLSVALAAALGYLVGGASGGVGAARGALLSAVGGLVTAALLVVAARPVSPSPPPRLPAPVREQNMLAAVLSLVIACSVVYALGRLVVS